MLINALTPTTRYKRVVQLELNEISSEVIDALIEKGKLPTFARLKRDYTFLKTTSENEYKLLEPWIQWVTAHTGRTFDEHRIFHLSDVHTLEHPQIWEALSRANVESAVIGSMNVVRRDTEGGIFFPDPWAITNETYPEALRPLWELISSRVKTHATAQITLADVVKGLKACFQFHLPIRLYAKIARQVVGQKLNPKTKWRLAGVFDLLLAEIFQSVLKTTNYGFYTLFLNSVAHYQHHYWRAFDGKNFDPSIKYPDIQDSDDPMSFGYELYDQILGNVLRGVESDPETLVVILSGLSQVPYTAKEAEGGMNYYRLNDHQSFATLAGLDEHYQIFALMSRDWQVKYPNDALRQHARKVLLGMTINGEQLFNFKEDTEGFIFLETKYTRSIQPDDMIFDRNGKPLVNFNDVFTNIAIKSGHHTGVGNLWLSAKPAHLNNGAHVPLTALYNFTLDALNAAPFKNAAATLKHEAVLV